MARFFNKIPNFRLRKIKLDGIEHLNNVTKDILPDFIKNAPETTKPDKEGCYEGTDYKTIKEVFLNSTKLYGEKEFILQKFNRRDGFEEISYSQFAKDVNKLGTGLTKAFKLGGEKIVIISETTYEWYVSYIAMLCGAGIAVPTDKELPDNELINIIERSEAAAVIYSPKKKSQIEKVANKCPGVKYFMEMYSDSPVDGRNVGLDYVMQEGSVPLEYGDTSFMDIEIDPEEFAVLIFTSGTTSQSKGVMLCQRNLAANINGITPYVKLYPYDRMFSVLPLHHTYESTIGFLYPMAVGASIVVCQGLKHLVDDMKETHPTCMLAVPLLIETLYNRINKTIEKSHKTTVVNSMMKMTSALSSVGIDIKRKVFKDIHENFGGRLRIIVSAAAPIDAAIGHWVENLGIYFLQGYGLTETAPITAVTPDFDRRIGSAGKVVHGNMVKVEEPNENGEGEIWIKGETVMMGYYRDEEATNKCIVDGWFDSGDVGYMTEDNFVYITGRSKNVIVTQNGKNIYPEEIELLLNHVEEIKESFVYGKEIQGEKELIVTCRAIPNKDVIKEKYADKLAGSEPTEAEMYKIIMPKIKDVNGQLSNYKRIKSLELKQGEFIKTSTMKVKRYAELQTNDIYTEK